MTDHICNQIHRIDHLEERFEKAEVRIDEHSDRLTKGDTQFIRVENKIEQISNTLDTIVGLLKWIGGSIGAGILMTAGGVLIWGIKNMGGQ